MSFSSNSMLETAFPLATPELLTPKQSHKAAKSHRCAVVFISMPPYKEWNKTSIPQTVQLSRHRTSKHYFHYTHTCKIHDKLVNTCMVCSLAFFICQFCYGIFAY